MPPVVTDVPYSIVPTDAKMVRAKSRYVNAAAEIHSYIPVLTVISLMLQLWDLFIKLDVILAIIITLLQKSLIIYVTVITITIIIIFYIHIKPYRLLVVVLFFFGKDLFISVFFILEFLKENIRYVYWWMHWSYFFLRIIPVTPHEKYNVILLNSICIDRMLASLSK